MRASLVITDTVAPVMCLLPACSLMINWSAQSCESTDSILKVLANLIKPFCSQTMLCDGTGIHWNAGQFVVFRQGHSSIWGSDSKLEFYWIFWLITWYFALLFTDSYFSWVICLLFSFSFVSVISLVVLKMVLSETAHCCICPVFGELASIFFLFS